MTDSIKPVEEEVVDPPVTTDPVFDDSLTTIKGSKDMADIDKSEAVTFTIELFHDDGTPVKGLTDISVIGLIGAKVLEEGDAYTFTVTPDEVGTFNYGLSIPSLDLTKSNAFNFSAYDSYQDGLDVDVRDKLIDYSKSKITMVSPKRLNIHSEDKSTVVVSLYHNSDPDAPFESDIDLEIVSESGVLKGDFKFVGRSGNEHTFNASSKVVGVDTFKVRVKGHADLYTGTDTIEYYIPEPVFSPRDTEVKWSGDPIDLYKGETGEIGVSLYLDNGQPLTGIKDVTLSDGDESTLLVESSTVGGFYSLVVEPVSVGKYVYTLNIPSLSYTYDKPLTLTAFDSYNDAIAKDIAESRIDYQTSKIVSVNPDRVNWEEGEEAVVTITLFHHSDNTLPFTSPVEVELVSTRGSLIGEYSHSQSGNTHTLKGVSIEDGTDTFQFKLKGVEPTTLSKSTGTVTYYSPESVFDPSKTVTELDPLTVDICNKEFATAKFEFFLNRGEVVTGLGNIVITENTGKKIKVSDVREHDGKYSVDVTPLSGVGSYALDVSVPEVGYEKRNFGTFEAFNSNADAIAEDIATGNFDSSKSTISKVTPNTIVADGMSVGTLTVKLLTSTDQHPLTGYSGLSIITVGGKSPVGKFTLKGEVDGVYTFEVSSNVVGEEEVTFKTATDSGKSSIKVVYRAVGSEDPDTPYDPLVFAGFKDIDHSVPLEEREDYQYLVDLEGKNCPVPLTEAHIVKVMAETEICRQFSKPMKK